MLQKRPIANGRSAEITSTTASPMRPARSLNLRVEVAQVGVSRLGTMLRTLRLPAKLASVTSLRSLPTRLNAGAMSPTAGNLPASSTGLPPRVTLAMMVIAPEKGTANGPRSREDTRPQGWNRKRR